LQIVNKKMAKETKLAQHSFEELKALCSKTIVIVRETEYIGLSYNRAPKAFAIGERLNKIHPHQTPDGKKHKGNMEIIETNALRTQAIAKCILPNCQEMVLIEAENG